MFTLPINGKEYATDQDMNLLDFLRDELRLTSVKDGCSEGACGACMVLVDGKASRACLFTTAKLAGRKVTTLEGLSQREHDVYSWTFANAGAVQCGFCIPGMVISAKGLLDANPDPQPADVKKALNGNICRCTGYAKIEQAVLRAAKVLREDLPVPVPAPGSYGVGDRMPRPDARGKVLGTGEYVNDMFVPGMLHGAALRAPKPRVRVLAIDTSEAEAMPGVVLVLTAGDVPGERFQGHIVHDWPAMIAVGEETRYVGDALALVAAGTRDQAKAAAARIRLEYRGAAAPDHARGGAARRRAQAASQGQPAGPHRALPGRRGRGHRRRALRLPPRLQHSAHRARLPGAGKRAGGARSGRHPDGLHRHPEHL